jgi:uncharacterized integral membrane protein
MAGSAGGSEHGVPTETRRRPPSRREQARTISLIVLVGLGVAFAVLNFDEVAVNWVFGTWSTPLIVVIGISFLLGSGVGFLLGRRPPGAGSRRSRRRR